MTEPATLHIEQDGAWVPVEGITDVQFGPELPTIRFTDEEREQLRRVTAEFNAVVQQFVEGLRPAIQAAAAHLAQVHRALRTAGLIDEGGKSSRRRDRPAWQTPYGPAHRTR